MTRGKNIELFICHYVVDFLDFLYCPRVFNTADNSLKAKQIFINAFLGVFQSSSWLRQMSFYIFSGMVIYACILFEYISLFTSSHFYLTSYHSAILLVKTSSGTKIESQVYCTNLVHCRFTLAVGDDPFFPIRYRLFTHSTQFFPRVFFITSDGTTDACRQTLGTGCLVLVQADISWITCGKNNNTQPN